MQNSSASSFKSTSTSDLRGTSENISEFVTLSFLPRQKFVERNCDVLCGVPGLVM